MVRTSVPVTPTLSEESMEKKRHDGRKISKWFFWRKNRVQPLAIAGSNSETPKEAPQTVSPKLPGGANPQKAPKKTKRASAKRKVKAEEMKQPSVKTATKRPEVEESPVRMNLPGLVETTAMRPDKEERKNATLYGLERKADREMTQYEMEKEMEKLNQDLMELILSYEEQCRKETKDPYAFSLNNMMSERNVMSVSQTSSHKRMQSLTQLFLPDRQLLSGGLPNFAYNCYVNASLQCLFRAETFCRELSKLLDNSPDRLQHKFLSYFVELSKLREDSEVQEDIDQEKLLLGLIASAAEINPAFTIDNQNDAHEFLCYCLNKMEESGQTLGWQEDVDPRCPVRSNFKFKMRNIIKCLRCGHQQSNRVEVFNHVSVPLEDNSVDRCLDDVIKNPAKLERRCQVCGGDFALSKWMVNTLPQFLILQLNRFIVTEHHIVRKLKKAVQIKPELQIYCHPQSGMPRTENSKAEASQTDSSELGGSTSTYRLISVMSHVGRKALSGHYVSDCSSQNPPEWKTYDDEMVTATTETKVLKMRSTTAYVLFYERVSTG